VRHNSTVIESEAQRTDDAPESSRNMTPDMNRLDQLEIPGMANQIINFNLAGTEGYVYRYPVDTDRHFMKKPDIWIRFIIF
jgi:hypothetical protein